MLKLYRQLWALTDPDGRRLAWRMGALFIVVGIVEVAGIASLLPFLAALTDPEAATHGYLRFLRDSLDFPDSTAFLRFLAIATISLFITGQILRGVTLYALMRFAMFRELNLGIRLMDGYLGQPYAWFLNRNSADLGANLLSEVRVVVASGMIPALKIVVQVVLTVLLVIALFVVDPVVAGVMLLVVGVGYALTYLGVRSYLRRLGRDRVNANAKRYRVIQEAFAGIKEAKLMGLEAAHLEQFRRPSRQIVDRGSAYQIVSQAPRYMLEAVVYGAMIALLLVLLASGGAAAEALPKIGFYGLAGARLFPALQQIYAGSASLGYTRPAIERLLRDLEALPEGAGRPPPADPIRPHRSIVLEAVRYAYPEAGRPSLNGLDVAIPARKTVGVVGPSGAGKTTTVDVLLGLLVPDEGRLRVDDTVIGPQNVRRWQRALGYVPQHIFLADDTVAGNIALGIPSERIDMAAVERAARLAELHDFVTDDLPLGYRTRIGERGVRLSGGQRQRIGIARALYRDPDVIVFDEATSALDETTEQAVMAALARLGGERTLIIIAHRPSTVAGCDIVFRLEEGRCIGADERQVE